MNISGCTSTPLTLTEGASSTHPETEGSPSWKAEEQHMACKIWFGFWMTFAFLFGFGVFFGVKFVS